MDIIEKYEKMSKEEKKELNLLINHGFDCLKLLTLKDLTIFSLMSHITGIVNSIFYDSPVDDHLFFKQLKLLKYAKTSIKFTGIKNGKFPIFKLELEK